MLLSYIFITLNSLTAQVMHGLQRDTERNMPVRKSIENREVDTKVVLHLLNCLEISVNGSISSCELGSEQVYGIVHAGTKGCMGISLARDFADC